MQKTRPSSRLGGLESWGVARLKNTIAKFGLGANFLLAKELLFNPHGLGKNISMFRWFWFANIQLLVAFFCVVPL